MLTHAIILPTLQIETWRGGVMEGRERQQIDRGRRRDMEKKKRKRREKKSDMK